MITAVDTRGLSVTLGDRLVLHNLAVRVARGEWLGLIGPNGAGKTTFLRALAGLVPFTGTVVLEGRSISAVGRRDAASLVALVPQTPLTPAALTVSEYVLLGRTPHIGRFGSERGPDRAAATRAISRLGLRPFAHRLLGSLSGGERQRVVLARALAQDAPILLLDEPTSALDLGRQQRSLELIDSLRRDKPLTVISSMHDLSLACQYADRLMLLDRGEIVAEGDADVVLTESTISSCYDADVRVLRDRGSVLVTPRRQVRR